MSRLDVIVQQAAQARVLSGIKTAENLLHSVEAEILSEFRVDHLLLQRVYLELGHCERHVGNSLAAAEYFTKSLFCEPTGQQLAAIEAQSFLAIAILKMDASRLEDAIDGTETAIERLDDRFPKSDCPEIRLQRALLLWQRAHKGSGDDLDYQFHLQESVKQVNEVLTRWPEYALAHSLHGLVLARRGDIQGAFIAHKMAWRSAAQTADDMRAFVLDFYSVFLRQSGWLQAAECAENMKRSISSTPANGINWIMDPTLWKIS